MPTPTLESISHAGHRLRLEFTWLNDRYAHRISRIDSLGAIQPLLESIEGAAQDPWPPSPPMQSLTIEKQAGARPVALLLGMAGNAHWSASIEPAADSAALHFDIACRHRETPGPLGSRYRRLIDSPGQVQIHGDGASVRQDEKNIEIRPAAISTAGTTRWRFTLSLR